MSQVVSRENPMIFIQLFIYYVKVLRVLILEICSNYKMVLLQTSLPMLLSKLQKQLGEFASSSGMQNSNMLTLMVVISRVKGFPVLEHSDSEEDFEEVLDAVDWYQCEGSRTVFSRDWRQRWCMEDWSVSHRSLPIRLAPLAIYHAV